MKALKIFGLISVGAVTLAISHDATVLLFVLLISVALYLEKGDIKNDGSKSS